MRKIFSEKAVSVSGMLVLTEKGYIYQISNLNTALTNVKNISKISSGANHYVALTPEGIAYAWGTNSYGECGWENTGTTTKVYMKNNIRDISAGNQITLLETEDGEVFSLGNNANGQIGLNTTAKISTPTKANLTENVKIEGISARKLHTQWNYR
ncbi:MAG: hypothetical protein HFJ50_06745 [Clostridia bacterium]|jgi:alpha-tubulin suppressor-like RCC1 family protein|nr:hypothetical protein [Clostridia bacterium]